jgi:hypothetical protein
MSQDNTLIILLRNEPSPPNLDLDSYVPNEVQNLLFLVQANDSVINFTGNVGFNTKVLFLKCVPSSVTLTLRAPLGEKTSWGQGVQFQFNGANANISGGNTFTRVALWFNGMMYDTPLAAGSPPSGTQSVLNARVLEINGSSAYKHGY